MVVRILHYADIENAFDAPERVGRLAGAIAALRDDSTVVTGGGDNTAPGVLSLACEGEQAQDFYKVVEPAIDVYGNHDFDHGFDAARRTARKFPGTWLNANAVLHGDLFASEATTPTTIVEAGDDHIGFVGVTTESLPDINPEANPITIRDAVKCVRSAETNLRNAGADFVVAVSHRGNDDDIARETTVDAVLGGHDHEEQIVHVNDTLVARPGDSGHSLLDVTLDDHPTATVHKTANYPVVDTVAAALRDRMDSTGLSETIDHVEEPVTISEQDCKAGESAIGNFVTDALRHAGDADVALTVGGIRESDPLNGDVTVADIYGISPFDNNVVVAAVSGSTLQEAFEDLALAAWYDDAPAWWFGHVSGAELVYDDRNHAIIDANINGRPLVEDRTYEVAVSDYYAKTDHIVRAFGSNDIIRTAGSLRDALVEYTREHGIDPSVKGRIQRPYLDQSTAH